MNAARPALLLAVLALSGCISLFPKTKPAQLYQFGAPEAGAAAATPAAAATFAVRLLPIGFPVASGSDRILTTQGDQVAYIAGSRWVTSAASLFDAAVMHAFDTRGGAARLLARGELAPSAYALKLDVRAFEARYEHGPGLAPTIVVEVYAALDSGPAPATNRERLFTARIPATEDRMGAIAAAFDQAVGKVCADLVGWVGSKGA